MAKQGRTGRAQARERGAEAALAGLPLFEDLATDHLAALADATTCRSYRRGETVWSAGDPGDELVVVLQGGLDVWGAGSTAVPVGRIGPGGYVGELALLLDEPRSATVTCSRAAEVLCIPREAFRQVVREDGRVLARLTDLVSRRAMQLARGEVPPRPTIVVGVVAVGAGRGTSLVARTVAAVASDLVRSELVVVAPTELPGLVDRVEGIVTAAGRPRLVVLDLPRDAAATAGEACDAVVVVTDRLDEELPAASGALAVHHVVNLHPRRQAATGPLNSTSPYVLRHEPSVAVDGLPDPASPTGRTLARLTRKLLGVSVGLALGGGAAFGIAHVGILQALEEAGLPVDVVAGTSMGSIIAIGHAAGLSGDDMAAIADRIGNVRTTLSVVDPTLSGAGLLNGKRLVRIFAPLLPHERFDDLVIPCRVVAMDVETGERVDIGEGRLDHAFRASCSIPLVFTPVRDGDRTLVDGGMIDPVPVDVARDMGADIVIGVNVVPKLERGTTTALSRAFKTVSRFNPLARFGGGAGLPDLVDVLMNSLQVVEYELGEYKQLAAEVRVEVPLAEFTWIEFYRATEIIARGREVGQVAVEGLRAELARRLSS